MSNFILLRLNRSISLASGTLNVPVNEGYYLVVEGKLMEALEKFSETKQPSREQILLILAGIKTPKEIWDEMEKENGEASQG
jgi:hypothetical protein